MIKNTVSKIFFAVTILGLTACTQVVNYSSSHSTTQKLETKGVNKLIISCYCENHIVKRDPNVSLISLYIEDTYDIKGYHGSRQNAGATPISKDELYFTKKSIEGGTLLLESQEWIVIHHASLIDKLEITIPTGLEIEVNKIDWLTLAKKSN